MRLTVVLPLYNEEALLPGLPEVLERIRAALAGHEVRLICVDDGSSDGTAAGLARIDGIEVETHPVNRGPGAAMNTGIEKATGDAVLVYDADEAYDTALLGALVDALDDSDIATLSPYHPDGGVDGVGPIRLLLSRAASLLYRRKLKTKLLAPLYTYTCAVRAYRLPEAQTLLPAPDDFTAAAYLMATALRRGLRVTEVPARLRVRAQGSSKMRVLSTIRAHLKLLRDLSMTAAEQDRPAS